MKLINKLGLIVAGLALSIGSIAGSAFDSKHEKANATTSSYNGVFTSLNGTNSGFREENDNPDVWSKNKDTNHVLYSDLNTTNDTTLQIDSSFLADEGTTQISLAENTNTSDFVCAYIPFALYAQDFDGKSIGSSISVDFGVTHEGWSEKNYSNVTIMYLGTTVPTISSEKAFYTGSEEGAAISSIEKASDGVNSKLVGFTGKTTVKSTTITQNIIDGSIANVETDCGQHNAFLGYYVLFLYARKDGTSTHQLNVTLNATIKCEEVNAALATLDGKPYSNVGALFANVKTDGTSVIKLLQNASETIDFSTPYSVTFDLNNFIYTLNGLISISDGSVVTVKNGTIDFVYEAASSVSLFTVSSSSTLICESLTLKGAITHASTNSLIKNYGTTYIKSGTYTVGEGLYTYLIKNEIDGNMYVSGGSFSAGLRAYEFENLGNFYLSGTPSFAQMYQVSDHGMIYGASSETGTDYYTGNRFDLQYSAVPTDGVIIAKNFKDDLVNVIIISTYAFKFEGEYNSETKEVSIVATHFTVTYTLTNLTYEGDTTIYNGRNFTTTLIPAEGYKLPAVVQLKHGAGEFIDYTYDPWTGEIEIDQRVELRSTITIIASGVALTNDEIIAKWANSYLHMSDYNTNDGKCKDSENHYYLTAKTELLKLGEEVVSYFQTIVSGSNYDARLRYEAWAYANNDLAYCYLDDFTHIKSSVDNPLIEATSAYTVEIIIALIAFLGLSSLLLLKKKHN